MHKLLIPSPPRYSLKYKNQNGEIKDHTIAIIERKLGYFRAYSYGNGVRTFRDNGVLNIDNVKY